MTQETLTNERNVLNFGLMILLSVGAGIWGFLFPGRLATSKDTVILGIRLSSSFMLILLIAIGILIVLFAAMRDWKFKIGSGVSIHSKEISIIGSLFIFLAAFSFGGGDVVVFILYYYIIFILTLYWVVSLSLIPTAIFAVLAIVLLLIGVLLVYRKSDLNFLKWTFHAKRSNDFLMWGVVSLLGSFLLSSFTQFNYVSGDRDGFLITLQGLPFDSLMVDVLIGFYQNLEFYLYPLVLLFAGLFFLRDSYQKPAIRVFTSDFNESAEKRYKNLQASAWKFLRIMVAAVLVAFLLLVIQGLIGIDRTLEDLFTLQTELFKGFDVLDSGFIFGIVPLLMISMMLVVLVQLPRVLSPFIDSRVIKYTARRLLTIIPIFIGTSMISYALMSSTGNPIDFILSGYSFPEGLAELREQLTRIYGLDAPPQTQWLNWFFHFIMGDMGNSIYGGGPVSRTIASKIGPTLVISIIPLIFTLIIAVPIGIHAALNQYSKTDNAISVSVAIGLSIPIFLFILVLIIVFAYYIPALPGGGMNLDYQVAQGVSWYYVRIYFDTFINQIFSWQIWDSFFHLVIPVVAITTISLVLYVRLIRSGLLEVIRQDYILSAQAYGFPHRTIIWKHALQNVLIPIVTYIGLSIGGLLGGAPITETTLGWPGLGRFAVGQFIQYNYPMVMGIIMITAIMILLANLLTDIVYSVIDPRVTL